MCVCVCVCVCVCWMTHKMIKSSHSQGRQRPKRSENRWSDLRYI